MIIKKIPDVIKEASRKLRNTQTESEKILWNLLRYDKIGLRFLRQKPIYVFTEDYGLDRYIIADFYCDSKKIVIEVDGNIHNLKEVLELDKEKEKLLNNLGIKVIRFNNDDIINNLNEIKKQLISSLLNL